MVSSERYVAPHLRAPAGETLQNEEVHQAPFSDSSSQPNMAFPLKALMCRMDQIRKNRCFQELFKQHFMQEEEDVEVPAKDFDVEGQVATLSQHHSGCREVQMALESAQTRDERIAIFQELRGGVVEAFHSPHANHVLQKGVELLAPVDFDFLIDELLEYSLSSVAVHKYGCRIVQRLFENGSQQQRRRMTQALAADIVSLARTEYGNYVVHCLLEHASAEDLPHLLATLRSHLALLLKDQYGVIVVHKALGHVSHSECAELYIAIRETLAHNRSLSTRLLSTRRGQLIMQRLLSWEDSHENSMMQARMEAPRRSMTASSKVKPSNLRRPPSHTQQQQQQQQQQQPKQRTYQQQNLPHSQQEHGQVAQQQSHTQPFPQQQPQQQYQHQGCNCDLEDEPQFQPFDSRCRHRGSSGETGSDLA